MRRTVSGSIRRSLFVAALTLAISTVLPILLFGQGYFGSVTGVLTDSSGAVLAHANVVLTDQQKGFTFKSTSDDNGSYLFRAVPPGLYSRGSEDFSVPLRHVSWS